MAELIRTIERWQNCNPKAMAKMSEAAIMYAIADSIQDILMLHAEIERMHAEIERMHDLSKGKNHE